MVREGQSELVQGAKQMGIALSEQQQTQLLDYVDLLEKWNRAYNLTAVRGRAHIITRHLLDSLSVIPFIRGQHILDVGSGAGLPGVVLAIYFPDKHVTLLDSNGKKTRFLSEVKQALTLDNMTVIQARAEAFKTETLFNSIVSRAFASLGEMVALTRHLLAADGQWVAMKGQVPAQELSVIDKHYKVQAHLVTVPGNEAARHVMIVNKDN
jgi:16S rRNA (guanine527-N7)-methyltransferase